MFVQPAPLLLFHVLHHLSPRTMLRSCCEKCMLAIKGCKNVAQLCSGAGKDDLFSGGVLQRAVITGWCFRSRWCVVKSAVWSILTAIMPLCTKWISRNIPNDSLCVCTSQSLCCCSPHTMRYHFSRVSSSSITRIVFVALSLSLFFFTQSNYNFSDS